MQHPRNEWKNLLEGAIALATNKHPTQVTEIGELIHESVAYPIYELNLDLFNNRYIDLVLFWNGEVLDVLTTANDPLWAPPFFHMYIEDVRVEEVNPKLQEMHDKCSLGGNTYNCVPLSQDEGCGFFRLRRLAALPCLLEDIGYLL